MNLPTINVDPSVHKIEDYDYKLISKMTFKSTKIIIIIILEMQSKVTVIVTWFGSIYKCYDLT